MIYCPPFKKARSQGTIINIHYGYKFDGVKGLFDNYVNSKYDLKTEAKLTGNKGLYFIEKLMLNSLTGPMALKYHNTVTEIVSVKEAKKH